MTIVIEKRVGDKVYINGYCKQSETKPTSEIAMGSKMVEVDTGDTYYYVDEATGWAVPGSN